MALVTILLRFLCTRCILVLSLKMPLDKLEFWAKPEIRTKNRALKLLAN